MIQGNLLGLGMFVFAAIFIAFGAFVLKFPDWVVMITAGVVLVITDLIFRMVQKNQQGWLTSKNIGGYLFFIPVWIFGLAVVAINIISHFTKSK